MLVKDLMSMLAERIDFSVPGVWLEILGELDSLGEGENAKDCLDGDFFADYGGFAIYVPGMPAEVSYFGEFVSEEQRQLWLHNVIYNPKQYNIYKVEPYNKHFGDSYLVSGYSAFPDSRMLCRETDTHYEQYQADSDNHLTKIVYKKTARGYERVSKEDAPKSDFVVCCRGDLYKNPSNGHTTDNWNFAESKPGCYWGDKIYYNPDCPSLVLIRIDKKWVWVNKESFAANAENEYLEEYNMMQGIIG